MLAINEIDTGKKWKWKSSKTTKEILSSKESLPTLAFEKNMLTNFLCCVVVAFSRGQVLLAEHSSTHQEQRWQNLILNLAHSAARGVSIWWVRYLCCQISMCKCRPTHTGTVQPKRSPGLFIGKACLLNKCASKYNCLFLLSPFSPRPPRISLAQEISL